MLKKNLVILATLVATFIAAPVMAMPKIVNGIDANFPPFAYIDKTGKAAGFDVEVMDIIAKEIGVEVVHRPIEWSGIVTSLVTKKIDIVASGMSITPAREEQVNFSTPYWIVEQVMVVKKGSDLTVDDILNGKKRLGIQQGTSEYKWIQDEAKVQNWNVTLRQYDSSPLAVEDVVNGRIDAAAMDDAPAKDASSKKDVQILGTFGMEAEKFGYAVRKDDTELLEKVNTALANLMGTPVWQELVDKYELDH